MKRITVAERAHGIAVNRINLRSHMFYNSEIQWCISKPTKLVCGDVVSTPTTHLSHYKRLAFPGYVSPIGIENSLEQSTSLCKQCVTVVVGHSGHFWHLHECTKDRHLIEGNLLPHVPSEYVTAICASEQCCPCVAGVGYGMEGIWIKVVGGDYMTFLLHLPVFLIRSNDTDSV